MINKICFLTLILLSGFFVSHAQQSYLIGSSTVSIEPENSTFSVAIAGYGAPREGRFSLTWKSVSSLPEVLAVTGLNGKLYAATSSNELLEGTVSNQEIAWKNMGKIDRLSAITSLNGKLYGISNDNLLEGSISPNGITWKRLGTASNITALTGISGKLYAANSKNEGLAGSIVKNKVSWAKNGRAYRIISMTNDGERIYSLNSGDTLWYSKPKARYEDWREIGRHNSYTVDVRIKHIVVLNGRLYAVSKDNKLYLAEHNTKGDLTARTLAIKSGNKTALVVSADVTGFNYSFIKDIKADVYKKLKIPASAILINATHTHFAPVTQAWLAWGDFYHTPDSNYLNNTVKKGIIRSIELALNNMAPSEIYFARGSTNIGENRRATSNLEAPYDDVLDVLKVINTATGKNDILFSAGVHPVFNNLEPNSTFTLNANYPGVAKRIIQEKTGGNAIFMQGFGGDINPREQNYDNTGKELAEDVLAILKTDMRKISGAISYSLDTVHIPIEPWSLKKVQEFKAFNLAEVEIEKKNTPPYTAAGQFTLTMLLEREKNVRWANIMLNHYKNGTMPKTMPVYIQILNIGPWKLVGLSREVTTEYASAIRNIWPDKIVTVAGYCNDVPSYLPREWHIHARTYEGYDSFFWYGQPAIPPLNVREIVLKGIQKLNR